MNRAPRRLIRASEIGQFVYCRRAWWLAAVAGEQPANVKQLAHGTGAHASHGRSIMGSKVLRWLAIALAIAAVVLLVLAR